MVPPPSWISNLKAADLGCKRVNVATSGSHLLLQSLQGFELQAGQSDLDVFGNVWDEEAQEELEGQQQMLKRGGETGTAEG